MLSRHDDYSSKFDQSHLDYIYYDFSDSLIKCPTIDGSPLCIYMKDNFEDQMNFPGCKKGFSGMRCTQCA